MVHQLQFLMNDADADGLRLARAWKLTGSAVDSGSRRNPSVDAGEDLHQRRFAGAVLAHQRMDFAGQQLEMDIGERLDAGKALAETP